MTISLTKSSIGYDLRECGQAVTLMRGLDGIYFDDAFTKEEVSVWSTDESMLQELHRHGYSAQFSESDKEIPGGFLKQVAATGRRDA